MKKVILLLALIASVPSIAQEEMETFDLLDRHYQSQLEVLEFQENLLKTLLQIPFDKRAYIYPALFESNLMPKKIVTHPQIKIWKGKKPTKIAPQMQNFANEYLNYMPAKFYPLLDPDVWPQQPKENDWHKIGNMLKDTIVVPGGATQDDLLQQIKD